MLSRRTVLGGAGAAAMAAAFPAGFWRARHRAGPAAPGSGHGPRVVIVGSGLAGLGCAYRLWRRHGIRSEIYEYNPARAGGRVHTLHGFFDAGQFAEQHGEFISSEQSAIRHLAASFGLTLDNVNRYPPHTHPQDERMRFGGRFWRQASLNREWRDWAFELFFDAANNKAPWPTLHNRHTAWGWRWDHMPATQWIEENIRGGLESDFGRLCIAVLLDEYGGPPEEQSALNLIYLLGLYDSSPSGLQPRRQPQLSGTDEKWHIRGGNDQLISGLVGRLPDGTVRLDERLVALRGRGHGRYACTFSGSSGTREIHADHVVLALPFTRLREVELHGIDLPQPQLRAIRQRAARLQLEDPAAVLQPGMERRRLDWRHVYRPDRPGWLGDNDRPAREAGHPDRPARRRRGRGHRPPVRAHLLLRPGAGAMAADFLDCFETDFPGVRAAFNGKAFYAWSSGDPHIGGAYSYSRSASTPPSTASRAGSTGTSTSAASIRR